jgi:hypothetical protein
MMKTRMVGMLRQLRQVVELVVEWVVGRWGLMLGR